MRRLDDRTRVEDAAGGAGVLHQHAGQLAVGQPVGEVGDDDVDAHGLGAGADHVDGLRERVGVDDERAGGLAVAAAYERHGLGGRGALVEQRRVGGRQPGEVADHGLEVDEGLEPALGDLRLVRRVGGVPARVLEHVAADHRRRDRRVVAEPDHRLRGPVEPGDPAQLARRDVLGEGGRQVEVGAGADAAGDGGLHQRVEAVEAQLLEHHLDVGLAQPDVALDERRGREVGRVRHGGSLVEGQRASPSVVPRRGLQSCLVRTVRVPERFRGGIAPSALARPGPGEDSPVRDHQRYRIYQRGGRRPERDAMMAPCPLPRSSSPAPSRGTASSTSTRSPSPAAHGLRPQPHRHRRRHVGRQGPQPRRAGCRGHPGHRARATTPRATSVRAGLDATALTLLAEASAGGTEQHLNLMDAAGGRVSVYLRLPEPPAAPCTTRRSPRRWRPATSPSSTWPSTRVHCCRGPGRRQAGVVRRARLRRGRPPSTATGWTRPTCCSSTTTAWRTRCPSCGPGSPPAPRWSSAPTGRAVRPR